MAMVAMKVSKPTNHAILINRLEFIEKKIEDIQKQRTVLTEKEKQLEKLATEKDWEEVDNDNNK